MSARVAMNLANVEERDFSGLSSEEEQMSQDEMIAPPASSTFRLFARRFLQPAGVLAVAAALGYAGYELQLQSRLREPTGYAHTEDVDSFVELTVQRNMVDRTHCNGIAGRPTAYCSPPGTCCNNDHGYAYCCATGNECYRNVCIAAPGQCFPGEAEVSLADGSTKRLNELSVGEHVMVQDSAGRPSFEPVLSFLHQVPGPHESLTVEHALGMFRVSANHLVFAQDAKGQRLDKIASQLSAGDFIYLPSEKEAVRVLSVLSETADSGMYAPLTASGAIVVDGILASNYATHGQASWIPHSTIHAAFSPVRIYHMLGLGMQAKSNTADVEMHPYVDVFLSKVGKVMGHYK